MVLIASTLLFVTGSAVLDAIESGAEDEQSQLFIDETNHNLLTVASTGHAQELPISDMSTDRFVVDSNAGEINVTWHGGDETVRQMARLVHSSLNLQTEPLRIREAAYGRILVIPYWSILSHQLNTMVSVFL